MVALKNSNRASSGSYRISMTALKRLEKAVENPPKANKALKDFIRKGEALLKQG